MRTSPDRQTFRALVADVAARAKEKLPTAVNGRVESAARLVLLHDVQPQADGSILVGLSTDPLKTYRLEGTTCTCQDFQHGKGIEGWCQHRIAAGIHKRVQELLPQEPEPVPGVPDLLEPWPDNDLEETPEPALAPAPVPVVPLPEAPASVNVRVQVAGREVQWTLRDTDEERLAVRLEALLARYPVPQPARPQAPASSQGKEWCAVHQVQMRWNEGKEGRNGWYSHQTPDGQWCKGK
jgi:hypothetical protein